MSHIPKQWRFDSTSCTESIYLLTATVPTLDTKVSEEHHSADAHNHNISVKFNTEIKDSPLSDFFLLPTTTKKNPVRITKAESALHESHPNSNRWMCGDRMFHRFLQTSICIRDLWLQVAYLLNIAKCKQNWLICLRSLEICTFSGLEVLPPNLKQHFEMNTTLCHSGEALVHTTEIRSCPCHTSHKVMLLQQLWVVSGFWKNLRGLVSREGLVS